MSDIREERIHVKNPKELAVMREAALISSGALLTGGAAIHDGVTTFEIDRAMMKFLKDHGAKPSFKGLYGFPGNSCISVNAELIHGIPSKRKFIRNGDIVSIDVGATYKGFNGDNAYTFVCGGEELLKTDEIHATGVTGFEVLRLLHSTKAILYKAISVVRHGCRVGDIGYTIAKCTEAAGFHIVNEFVGHGIGKKPHEAPEIPNYGDLGKGKRLVTNCVAAIEPMVNYSSIDVDILSDKWTAVEKNRKPSAHYEHTVIVTENGAEIITNWDLCLGEHDRENVVFERVSPEISFASVLTGAMEKVKQAV